MLLVFLVILFLALSFARLNPFQVTLPSQDTIALLRVLSPLISWKGISEYLLVLQTLVAVLGAFPAYALTVRPLRSPVAGLVFSLLYLALSFTFQVENPAVNPTFLLPTLFLLTLWLHEAGHTWAFVLSALLAASTGLGSGLMVMGMGAVLWWRKGRTRHTTLATIGGGVLALVAFALAPGDSLREVWAGLPHLLLPLVVWLSAWGIAHAAPKLASTLNLAEPPTRTALLASVVVFSLMWGYWLLWPLPPEALATKETRPTAGQETVVSTSTPGNTSTSGVPGPTPTLTPTPASKPVVLSPLCGKALSNPDDRTLRPILVKIDNTSLSRPQDGLAEACMVFEHLTEAGITRLAALFHTERPDPVGPVRSARPIDLELAQAFQALFSHVGGNELVMRQIANSPIADLDQFWDGKWQAYYRLPSRVAPFNIYTSIALLRAWAAQKGLNKPVNLSSYSFLTDEGPSGPSTVTSIKVPFAKDNLVEYRYDPSHNSYLRYVNGERHTDANTLQQLRAMNVVVLHTLVWPTDYRDPNGAPVLEFQLRGEGKIEVFRDGLSFAGKWVRRNPSDQFQFLDEMGQPMAFRTGNVWIAVVSTQTAILTDKASI